MLQALSLFEAHRSRLDAAREAIRTRRAHTAFVDQPGQYPDHANARAAAEQVLQERAGSAWSNDQPGLKDWVGEEVSPYTQQPLGIRYARCDLDSLFAAGTAAIASWQRATVQERCGVLLECLDRIYSERMFELTVAVMHTTGQSFNMSFAGSGVNALDRGLEALAYAHDAMLQVPASAVWERSFGSTPIRLEKRYQLVPRGVAVCFSCASFPTWNAYPSMIASLATGNAVIVKPHPTCVLPMAITIQVFRDTLARCGFDPNLVCLAPDTLSEQIGKKIIEHPSCAIVDFTGSARFGQWVEQHAPPAPCFTETSGCNVVVVDSCDDLDAVIRSLATTLCLFSAQMCTSPQNIYVPLTGVRVGRGALAQSVSVDEFGRRLAAAIDAIGSDPRKASAILAALQSSSTAELLQSLTEEGRHRSALLLAPRGYAHPEFPAARTSTPLVLRVGVQDRDLYIEERFGPISFVIETRDSAAALAEAAQDVKQGGGITAFLYSTDEDYVAKAVDAMSGAGAQLTVNLTGPMPLNFSAAYSDYHVTGLNPAGNATLTDASFVASRFRITQVRRSAHA
jgi:phenylacetic acid degradation protein paaN